MNYNYMSNNTNYTNEALRHYNDVMETPTCINYILF